MMFNALEDIKLETIEFNWIKETTKISHLKRAIRLIEMDGNYFQELKDACYDRIGELDPTQKRVVVDNRMMPEIRAEIDRELEEWEKEVGNLEKSKRETEIFQSKDEFDPETYFDNKKSDANKRKQAQNQKTKGNEAVKSKDYQEALKYYNKSIELDPTLHQSYGNRALAYIRLKEFQKAIADCECALKIDPQYTKAYHRKAKALIGIKNRVEAYKALQEALKIEPENKEVSQQLKEVREEMSEEELRQLEGRSQFKKITIEEESDEDEQIEEK